MKSAKQVLVVLMIALFAVVSVSGTRPCGENHQAASSQQGRPVRQPDRRYGHRLQEPGRGRYQRFRAGRDLSQRAARQGQDVVQQVKAGVIQAGIHSVGGFASIYPLIGVLDVPFAFPNISKTYEVFDGPFGAELAGDINAKTGLHVLGFGDSGRFLPLDQLQAADPYPGRHERRQDPYHGAGYP